MMTLSDIKDELTTSASLQVGLLLLMTFSFTILGRRLVPDLDSQQA
jgi:hypothetical protein